ncbi:MAG: GNAT family N-acetyltransferase [bacterium]|nr:GNAT family N-acetyltransferase [bacterium]
MRSAEKPNVTVKRLSLEDLDLLMEWRERVLREVFELADDADIDELMDQNRSYYERHLPDGSHVAVLALDAERDGEPVGCGALCLYDEMPSPDNPTGLCAYLMNIYTVPSARKQGVAGVLVDWLVAYAHKAGAGKVYLETTDAARGIYAARGFIEMKDYLTLGER